MPSIHIYSSKAEKYARYRWHYAPAAVEALCEIAELGSDSRVVDVGAGTGILTGCLAGRAGRVLGVEPDLAMLQQARASLPAGSGCELAAGCAESLPLATGWADAVTAAQAVHWFEPHSARSEFRRALRPGGWLALLRNLSSDPALDAANADLVRPEFGARLAANRQPARQTPVEFWYEGGRFQRLTFEFTYRETWDAYLGALCSASFMPDEDDPLFPPLERAARAVFDRFAVDGWLAVRGETELVIGQPG